MLVPEDMRRVGSRPAPQFAADSDTIDSGAGEVGLALEGIAATRYSASTVHQFLCLLRRPVCLAQR